MGRPPGAANKKKPGDEGYKKPGRISGSTKLVEQFTDRQIKQIKQSIIEMIECEEADNLSQAADKLNMPKTKLYFWAHTDKDWASQLKAAENIKADRLEEAIDNLHNVVGYIFRLKKLRHEYRDSYKFDVTSEGLEKLLAELKVAGKGK